MAFYSTYFTDFAGLQNAITQHADNEFINKPPGLRGTDPMPLLFPNSSADYALTVRDDGLIVASATFHQTYRSASASIVGQVSVRDTETRKGHGTSMVQHIFHKAAQDNRTLIITPFEKDGVAASHIVPYIHSQYPSVDVVYDGQSGPINGYRRYTLQQTAFGLAPVTF